MNDIYYEDEDDSYGFEKDVLGVLVAKPYVTNFMDHVNVTILLETGGKTNKITLLCKKEAQSIPKLAIDASPVGKVMMIYNVTHLSDRYFYRDCRTADSAEISTLSFESYDDMVSLLTPYQNVSINLILNSKLI